MNKRDARKSANTQDWTAGELRNLIAKSPTGGKSRVNRTLTKAQALEVLDRALEGIPDDSVVNPADTVGRRNGGKVLTVQNILWEAA